MLKQIYGTKFYNDWAFHEHFEFTLLSIWNFGKGKIKLYLHTSIILYLNECKGIIVVPTNCSIMTF